MDISRILSDYDGNDSKLKRSSRAGEISPSITMLNDENRLRLSTFDIQGNVSSPVSSAVNQIFESGNSWKAQNFVSGY